MAGNISENERYDTVGVMRSDLNELTARIQLITLERNQLERQLSKNQLERLQLMQESDDRLDDQAQRYEEKITELHSVIAELSKKLDAQRPNLIREEDEVSQNSGDSPQRSSNNNNPNESCTDYEDDGVLVPPMAVLDGGLRVQMESPGKQKTLAKTIYCQDDQCYDCQLGEDSYVADKQFMGCKEGNYCCGGDQCSAPSSSGVLHPNHALQMTQLRRELLALRTEGDMFKAQVSRQESELNKSRANVASLKEERDRLRRKIRELQTRVQSLLTQQSSQGSQSGSPARSKSPHVNPTTGERTPTSREDAPIAKIAERVKLKKVESGDRHICGSDIISAGVSNSKVAEHLVRGVQEDSNAQEILQSLHSSGSHVPELRVREFEVETERLNSKVEHMQSQNDLLVLALEESRTQCDRLSVLIGKYESNNTALQLALACTDHALEASEALERLQETETQLLALGLAAASVTMNSGQATVNNEQSIRDASIALRRAQESRKTAEAVAKRLLHRLDRGLQGTYPSATGCGISPWEDLSSHSHTTSTTSSTSSYGLHGGESMSTMDIQRLREFVRQMQGERAAIRATIAELESVHIDPVAREPSCKADAQRLDLENAVLMQELMALKEEKAELRAQYYLLEKEKSALELRLSSREAQEHAYMVQIEHLKCEVREQQQAKEKLLVFHSGGLDSGRGSHDSGTMDSCPSGCGDELTHNLMECLQREKRLKCRVQELVSTLEKVSRNSELRHQQSAEFVSDLKRANSALISAFEKSKKKYQSKFKRMEQQMMTLVERHTTQVRVLQNRIAAMDEQSNLQNQQCTSETSL